MHLANCFELFSEIAAFVGHLNRVVRNFVQQLASLYSNSKVKSHAAAHANSLSDARREPRVVTGGAEYQQGREQAKTETELGVLRGECRSREGESTERSERHAAGGHVAGAFKGQKSGTAQSRARESSEGRARSAELSKMGVKQQMAVTWTDRRMGRELEF